VFSFSGETYPDMRGAKGGIHQGVLMEEGRAALQKL